MKKFFKNKKNFDLVSQILRWSVFIMASVTMSLSIANVAAYNSLQLISKNPEIAQYSTLVNSGYILIK
jgi:hypothetical protein